VGVFGDEVFRGVGCGYNMHPHHNFIICAFVLEDRLTTINTIGNIDQWGQETTTRSRQAQAISTASSTSGARMSIFSMCGSFSISCSFHPPMRGVDLMRRKQPIGSLL
jgi:hypothetical protein